MLKKKRHKKEKTRKGEGSILIGVVLLFILISSIALAIVSRSGHGAILTTDSKKGYSAYQDSDSDTEKILNNLKSLDNANDGRIPENTPAYSVCDGGNCYKSNEISEAVKVADAFFIKKSGEAQGLSRSIFAPIPDRVANPVSDLKVSAVSPNRCDIRLDLSYSSPVNQDVSGLELRKSSDSSSLDSGTWKKLEKNTTVISYPSHQNTVLIKNSEFEYGKKYYFSIKAKNKNPFQLDSFYYDSPSLPFANIQSRPICNGPQSVGCLENQPRGSSLSTNSYHCCEGTECYRCDSGWKVTGVCCTEVYVRRTDCSCGIRTRGHEITCDKYVRDTCKPTYSCSGCDSCQSCDTCSGSCIGSPCPPPEPENEPESEENSR